MQKDDRRTFPLLANKALNAPGRKAPSGRPMDLDRLAGVLSRAHRSTSPLGIDAILSDPGVAVSTARERYLA